MSVHEQIARELKIEESKILEIREWDKVYFVIIQGKGGRFVSKKNIIYKRYAVGTMYAGTNTPCDTQEEAYQEAYSYKSYELYDKDDSVLICEVDVYGNETSIDGLNYDQLLEHELA